MTDYLEPEPQAEAILLLEPGVAGHAMLDLRVSPEHVDQLRECLEAEGVHPSDVLEFSAGSMLEVLAISVGAGGAVTTALNVAITKFLERHKDKTVTFGAGCSIESMTGFSRKDVEQALITVDRLQRERDQQWAATVRELGPGADPGDETKSS